MIRIESTQARCSYMTYESQGVVDLIRFLVTPAEFGVQFKDAKIFLWDLTCKFFVSLGCFAP